MKKAEIIVLAGQSNAVGVGHTKYLPRHFDNKKVQDYTNGYEQVKIHYISHDTRNDDFAKTTLRCSEKNRGTFGPEVGFAERIREGDPLSIHTV